MLAILQKPYPLALGKRNELQPRVVSFSAAAEELFWKFVGAAERQMAPGGDYEQIRPFAAKLAEHAARLAASIAAYQNIEFTELGPEDFVRGMRIAVWYASEAKRIGGAYSTGANLKPAQMLGPAQKLLDWIKGWPKPAVSARDIYTYGPGSIRIRETAISLAEILVTHGHLEPVNPKQRSLKKWRIV
jgi:hypothetical protein